MPLHEETRPVAGGQEPPVRMIAGLLIAALLCHLVAAQLGSGGRIAYIHHIVGFFIIAAVTGLPIAGLTWLAWRRHRNRALLIFGLIQLLLGIVVVVQQQRGH